MSADAIADCVLSTFDSLPAKRKPRQRDDGAREWVPLSGIALSKGTTHSIPSIPASNSLPITHQRWRALDMCFPRVCSRTLRTPSFLC
ncbi:uncharacterized protein K441DRAFT_554588 [Cenococcum geophilum 1.58]|uniref:uncharacterized protein n=1 Tax=Cenococcum geophilum 1.58 TaxID=794803 RepID=UPI00358E1131|nr:hypothetical protein K441DRAFT_554588 [Cenococcum geophilum 1.58]